MRALAALAVFACHAELLGFGGGGIGVDVFFVISGFIITRMLRAEFETTGSISFAAFYCRRALRLWPALIVVCLVLWLAFSIPSTEWLSSVFYYSDFTRAWAVPTYPIVLGHTWSLAIEEQFYLIWPLVLLFALRSKHAFAITFSLALVAAAYRLYLIYDSAPTMLRLFNGPDTRADALMLGASLALANDKTVTRIGYLWLPAVVFLGWAVMNARWNAVWLYVWGLPAFALAAVAVVAEVVSRQRGILTRILEIRPLAGIGVISYAFYLWHYPLLYYFKDLGPPTVFILTLACAGASWILVEQPIQRRRKWIIDRARFWRTSTTIR